MNHTTPIRTALLLLASCALCAGGSQVQYQPTRESLSQHRVPEWYQDAKIGFFYHWGPQSVVGDKFDKDALLFCRAHAEGVPEDAPRLCTQPAAEARGRHSRAVD
jgi:hypothetical protein